jgi:DNA-binding GntR family transcriptional regulator
MPVSARSSQFDKALLGLRALVLNGAFEANARLSEVTLAERLSISRTPLRQAMDRLVDEGLLERLETSRLPLASPSAFLQGQEFVPDFQVSLRRAQEQHKAILAAIRAREGARAEALSREHARLARQNLEHVMKSDAGSPGMPGLALVSAN